MTLKDFMDRYGPTVAVLTLLGSMALLADGWHMSSHALALGVFL